MTVIRTPQTRCRAAFARADITPPVGMYHRMWGAAKHDRSTGIHKPLTATALCLKPREGDGVQLVIGVDHCLLDTAEFARLRARIAEAVSVGVDQVHVSLSHTHGAGWISRTRADLPGGDLIGPYLDQLAETCAKLAGQVLREARPATIVYGTTRCGLATFRDFWDEESQQFVTGYDPDGSADDTVMLAKVVGEDGALLGTIVNYACHPTTLAWENTLVSPDYVGAMREVIEGQTGGPCLFLQGASGDLGPREGFVGDTAVADRNGRQLGHAALSGLETIPEPGSEFVYAGPVVSGATLGTWEHRPLDAKSIDQQARWECRRVTVPLAYRADLPTLEETRAARDKWVAEEAAAKQAGDAIRERDCHAHVERMNRQITRLESLPQGKAYPLGVSLWRMGDALWVLTPGELYQTFQTTLRARFPDSAIVVVTLTDDWHPGYVPPASVYGYGIYQEVIAAVGAGSLEVLIEALSRELRTMS